MDVLLTIGEFSKMTYLSVKALRHYHEVGIIEPVVVDPDTGYRRYAASQVATAQAIRRFRDLDMPLDDVRRVLAAPDPDQRNAVIVEHLSRLQQELERTQASVASLQALLTEDPRPRADVELRHLAPRRVVATGRVVGVADAADWLDGALAALHEHLEVAGLVAAGPDGALWPDEFFEDDAGEVTAFVPIASDGADASDVAGPLGETKGSVTAGRSVVAGGRVGHEAPAVVELAPVTVAVLVHEGPFADADQTYGALGTIVAERGIGELGPIREHYLDDDRIEVCWPVAVGSVR